MRRPLSGTHVAQWRIMLIFIATFCVAAETRSSDTALIFFKHGEYVVIDKQSYRVIKEGHAWEHLSNVQSHLVAESFIQDIVWSAKQNRLFFRIVKHQTVGQGGYLVLSVDELKYIGILDASNNILLDERNSRVYFTRRKSLPAETRTLTTAILDSRTFATLRELEENQLLITRSACFLGDGARLYTNHRIFSSETGKYLKGIDKDSSGRPLPWLTTNCESGKIVLVDVESERNRAVLSLYDLASEQIVRRARATISMSSFSSEEWTLSKDGDVVIRNQFDTRKAASGMEERVVPGRLQFISLLSDDKVRELQLPVYGISVENLLLGFSADGSKLFYASSRSLSVVDVKSTKLLQHIYFPSRPVGVVWR